MVQSTLRSLHLSGFRSFDSQGMDFDNPTFVVGRNGSGKSNLVDAFAFLAEAMVSPLHTVIERRGGYSVVAHCESGSGHPANVALIVVLRNVDREIARAVYEIHLRQRLGSEFEVTLESCTIERFDGPGDSFQRTTLHGESTWESSAQSLVPDIESNALALPLIGGDRRFQAVFRFLSGMRTYRIEPAALRELQDPDGAAGLHADGRNAASVLREIQRRSAEDFTRICELLGSVVPGTVGVRPKMLGNKLTLEFTQRRRGSERVTFDAYSMSDGTLRAMGLLTAVFQRPAPSLLVIEEPEASVHPGAVGSILDLLRLAGHSMQVVVTTHSPDVLDAKWIEDRHLRILDTEDGVTCVSHVSEAVRTALKTHLMGAGEMLRSNALTAGPTAGSEGQPA